MAELVRYEDFYVGGDVPWTMTQNQRGPTCGCTSIAVAYRILTGWTVFPTKGNYRQFSQDRLGIALKKGDDDIFSVRKAAKYDEVSSAGEIVNADDMVAVINEHAEGVQAEAIQLDEGKPGTDFVAKVKQAFRAGSAPLVLFYIDGPTDEIGRQFDFQHWVNIYAVEDSGAWLYTPITNLQKKNELQLKQTPKDGEMLVWTWGHPYVVDGNALGIASALSINWSKPPRMWEKESGKPGQLKWKEISPKSLDYVAPSSSTPDNVRYTIVDPTVDVKTHGFVVMRRQ
jgi:hypothetical protein